MKIAFWSNVHGQTATTSNTLAVSIIAALLYGRKIALLQSHFSLNNMDRSLIGQHTSDLDIFNDIGIDALIRDIKSAPLNEETVVNDSISLLSRNISFYPCTQKNNRDTYEKDMLFIFDKVMDAVNEYHDDIFIDVASGNSELTNKILNHADLIVVNLGQNQSIIQDYFDNYHFDSKKVCYLIGNYNCNSRYNLRNLTKAYPNMKKRVAAIPYCVEFLDAQSEGETIKFLNRNFMAESNDKNFFFIQSVIKAVKMIDRLRREHI